MTLAAQLTPGELVLEPSAGTGLLAIHAEIAGAGLALNELAETRHALLSGLFPQAPVTPFNAEQIDDYLDAAIQPTTVLMNPPFSASPGIERTMRDATVRHIRSALRRLPDGGRLVVLTAANHDPAKRGDRRALCRSFGAGVLRVHRERRRPHLCPPWHQHRYAPHGYRPDSATGRRPACPGRSRRQPRRAARADRGEAAAATAIFFLSGSSRRPPADAPPSRARNRARNAVLPFRPRRIRARGGRSPLRGTRSCAPIRTSATGSMNPMRCRRSRLRARSRIRRSSCSRRPWPRSDRRFPPTGPCCRSA